MAGFVQELRSAARALGRAPGFAGGAVLTLAIAIAVNTALFSFVNAVFFRPLPYAEIDRLRHVVFGARGSEPFRPPLVDDVRAALAGVAEAGVYRERELVIGGGAGEPAASVTGTELEPVVLHLLGSRPVAGRTLEPGDAVPGGVPVVVIDRDLAEAQFGSAAAAVGSTLRIDGTARTVVGVLPTGLAFPDFARAWIPLEGAGTHPFGNGLRMLGRLEPAATAAEAAARIESLETGGPGRALIRPLQPQPRGETAAILGALGFLLLIACGNVAGLVLARGTARRHELGVRAVLGASRGRLVRTLLAEGLVIAGLAAGVGAIMGAWLADGVAGLIPADQLPLWFDASIDLRVLGWIAGAAALVTVVVSGLPALATTRGGLSSLIAASGTRVSDAHARRIRAGLVAVQIALATVLLAGAGMLGRSLLEMRRLDPGYDADRVLRLDTRGAGETQAGPFEEAALRQLAGLPGATGVAARSPAAVGARVASPGGIQADATVEAVTASFFETLGLPLLAGRAFTSAEADAGTFAVVSASLAEALFGEVDVVGRQVGVEGLADSYERMNEPETARRLTIVGVAAPRRTLPRGGLAGVRTALHLYVPRALARTGTLELLVRVSTDPLVIAQPAASVLGALSQDIVVRPGRTLETVEHEAGTDLRFFATIFGGFGFLALALAAIGIYGVVAYSVSRSTREIGVRIALGATPRGIMGLVARGVLPPTAIGLALGTAGAWAVTRALQGALHGLAGAPPLALAGVLVLFLGTALIAAWVPARRAVRVDPQAALRSE